MTPEEVAAEVRVLRDGVGAVPLVRDVVVASGDEVVDYLQGQLSQDVTALDVGASAHSFVLQPQGKVDVWFRITRTADDAVVLDCDPGWGEALVARLERFRLRTKVAFERVSWDGWAVRGARATAPPDPAEGIVAAVDRPGDRGFDLLGPAPVRPPDAVECHPAALEVLRIEAGTPRMGAELDEGTIPAEAGVVPVSVSFTKGCYTGQELVARIDSRAGSTPRRLVGLRIEGSQVPGAGDALLVDGAEVGRVSSATPGGSHGGPVALAYLKRGVDTPVTVELGGEGGPAVALDLPLVGT